MPAPEGRRDRSGWYSSGLQNGAMPACPNLLPDIPGIDHPKVLGYADVLARRVAVGSRVAIVGAGGIGFDVAEFLVGDPHESTDLDRGLHVTVDGASRVVEVDHVVICAGQRSERRLHDELAARGIRTRLIGGADAAAELDAVRAIDQAVRLAASL